MPLATRLALAVAAAVAGLVAMAGAVFIGQLRAGLDASLDAGLRSRADALVQQVGPEGAGEFQDSGAAGLLPPNEALAQVFAADGRLLDSSEGTRNRPLLTPAELARARTGQLSLTSISPSGESVRLLAVPLTEANPPHPVVVVGTSRSVAQAAVRRVRAGLVVGGLAAVLLSGFGTWLLAGSALRPVERMRRQAAEISVGDSAARLAVPATRDEVARLGRTMNALLERLQDAVVRQRNFVADAGHELRTPLTILRTELELAGRPGRSRAELAAAVTRSAEETERLIRLAEDLLVLARADSPNTFLRCRPVPLAELVGEAVRAAELRVPAGRVRLVASGSCAVSVPADPHRLRQVLDNLLDNAVRFSPPAGAVNAIVDCGPTFARVTVQDEGPGFPPEFLPHAFERFRRADSSRAPDDGGSGLGLAIVESLVRAHGGRVYAENRPQGGASVGFELPFQRQM